MMDPPSYPRIPYLSRADDDGPLVPAAELTWWLRTPSRVEEKLDGANVMVWCDEQDTLQMATRSGAGGMDRAGQLGRLRAWAAGRASNLRALLSGGCASYCEWLWLTHSVAYDALPDLLVVLDLLSPDGSILPIAERNDRAASALLHVPPLLHEGPVGDLARLAELTERSAFRTSGPAEGVVLRAAAPDGTIRRAKWVRPDFVRTDDAAWSRARPRNRLRSQAP